MGSGATYRLIGSANYWVFKRSYMASQMGEKKAFLFYRRSARFNRAFFNAAINYVVDGGGFIVGA